MFFGASTYVWTSPFSDESIDLIDKVAEIGFDAIEICIEDPSQINPSNIKNRLQEVGIRPIVCGAFGPDRDISAEDAALRNNGVDYIRTCIDIAQGIGANLVAGPMYSATGKARLLSPSQRLQQWAWAKENLRLVADYAAERNIALAVEPLNRFETDFLNTVEQAMHFMADVNCENVGLLLDTFHMNIEEKDICAALRLSQSKLFHFHACENDRGIPGTGHCPWEAIAAVLKEINYDLGVVIEAFTIDNKEIARAVSLWRPLAPSQDSIAVDGLSFLRKLLC